MIPAELGQVLAEELEAEFKSAGHRPEVLTFADRDGDIVNTLAT